MAGSQRYVRYILIAFLTLTVIWFVSSTSDPRERVKAASDYIKQHSGLQHDSESQKLNPADVIGKPLQPAADSAEDKEAGAGADAADGTATETKDDKDDKENKDDKDAEDVKDEKKEETNEKAAQKSEEKPEDHHHDMPSSVSSTSPKPTDELVAVAPGERMNATFVSLARNSDVWDIADSIRQVEDRFNRKFNYDWVFLNDNEFDDQFKKVTTALVSGKTRYGTIPKEHWSFPEWIDQDKAAKVRQEMAAKQIIYGDSISYRHMCRYESGFFFRHPLMLEYEWYWRVEPSVKLYCDINYDTFKFMAENKKKYSFVISLYEYVETIETLWDSVKGFIKDFPQHISEGNALKWISEDDGKTYNHCHFWSNFEIGNLNWLRSQAYLDYFNKLDKDGGFFYERWGDAPVHSIAAALMLKKEEIHFFNDISYWHVPFTHCPTGEDFRLEHKCHCNPKENFDWNGYSCTKRWYETAGMELPKGWGEGN